MCELCGRPIKPKYHIHSRCRAAYNSYISQFKNQIRKEHLEMVERFYQERIKLIREVTREYSELIREMREYEKYSAGLCLDYDGVIYDKIKIDTGCPHPDHSVSEV